MVGNNWPVYRLAVSFARCPVPDQARGLYWFRVLDVESGLMNLKSAELSSLVVVRAIQRDCNNGVLSVRQVAKRAKLSLTCAHFAHRIRINCLKQDNTERDDVYRVRVPSPMHRAQPRRCPTEVPHYTTRARLGLAALLASARLPGSNRSNTFRE